MTLLSFEETENLLLKYKIPFSKTKLLYLKSRAISFAKEIGYPVVLKISSPDILHKSEIKGVRVGIKNENELKKAWDEILISVKKSKPKLKIEGILVQKMVSGIEVAVGMKRDSQFGPVLMFGLGGIFIEVLKDVIFRIAPINQKEALKMIKEIKAHKIFKGFRGQKPINIKAIVKIITNLSKLSLTEKKIKEIDLNPIIINEKRAQVVDAKIIIKRQA